MIYIFSDLVLLLLILKDSYKLNINFVDVNICIRICAASVTDKYEIAILINLKKNIIMVMPRYI